MSGLRERVCVFVQGLSKAGSYDAGVFPAARLGEA